MNRNTMKIECAALGLSIEGDVNKLLSRQTRFVYLHTKHIAADTKPAWFPKDATRWLSVPVQCEDGKCSCHTPKFFEHLKTLNCFKS